MDEHRAKKTMKRLSLLFFLLFVTGAFAQEFDPNDPFAEEVEEIDVGGDIFSDFNEDIEATQVMEAERFFRYGRFFSLQFSLGLTNFDGNRGVAYEDTPPSYGLGVNYFSDFRNAYGLGFEFSRHHFFVDHPVNAYREPLGIVEAKMLRFYFNYRYYVDTVNLGTAITWSNPYFTGRLEYWYLTNTFKDQEGILPKDSGGSPGFALGFGLEFPIKIRESYLGLEALWHTVNFHDKYTQDYRPIPDGNGFGHEDLSGSVYTLMASYVINW